MIKEKLYSAHPFIVTTICIAVVLTAFVGVRNWEQERLEHNFIASAETYQVLLDGRLHNHIVELDATRRLFTGSNFVSRKEFSIFVTGSDSKQTDSSAVFWAPRITPKMRPELEIADWNIGLQGRAIHGKDLSSKGQYEIPAEDNRTYFPILYAEPANEADQFIGFDLASDPGVLHLLEQSRDTATTVLITGAEGLSLMHFRKSNFRSNMNFVQPVFQANEPNQTVSQRRKNHIGFIIRQFDIGQALEYAVSAINPIGFDFYIIDANADAGDELIYFLGAERDKSKKPVSYATIRDDGGLQSASKVGIPGQKWTFIIRPTPQYLQDRQEYQSLSVLLFGLMLSGLFGALLFKNVRRTAFIQDMVHQRTHELENSETRLRALVENIAEGVVMIDKNGTIETFNPATERMFGYTAAEIVGKNVNVLIPEQERRSHDSYVTNSELTAPRIINKSRDLYGQRSDGTSFPLEITVSRMNIDGDAKFIGIMHDISERKSSEQMTRHAREIAETSSRAKTELLANMSHELRTPLNAIIGFSQTFMGQMFGPLGNERYLEYATDIHNSGQHLLELINDILDVSAIEAGRINLNEEDVDLRRQIKSMVRLIAARALEGKVSISTDIPADRLFLRADERRIKQILLNLLSNAVKFCRENGSVQIRACRLETGAICVIVSDTGIGMNKDEIKLALSRFGQADSGLNRNNEGTGLGLPLTVSLVELHGGTLDIASNPGTGTVVTVIFPENRTVQDSA